MRRLSSRPTHWTWYSAHVRFVEGDHRTLHHAATRFCLRDDTRLALRQQVHNLGRADRSVRSRRRHRLRVAIARRVEGHLCGQQVILVPVEGTEPRTPTKYYG